MKILYFDIAAIMIVSILLMSLYFRKMLNGRVNKILAWLFNLNKRKPIHNRLEKASFFVTYHFLFLFILSLKRLQRL